MSRFSKLPIDSISNMVYDIRDTTLRIKYKVVVTNLLNNYNLFGIEAKRPGSRRPSERVIITIYGNQPDKGDYAHLPEWIMPQEGVTGLSSVIFHVGLYVSKEQSWK